ncbi:polyketide synthase AufI, partial [Streptomyces zinciresistens K42]
AEALRRAADAHTGLASGAPSVPQRLGFVYSGQAGQWAGMGVALAEGDALVRGELLAWDRAIATAGGPALMATLAGAGCEEALRDTRFAQLAIAALQAALTGRLDAWGLRAEAVCGHSVGEVSAALASGALTREQAVEVIMARGEALHAHASGGAMYAVRAGAGRVAEALARARRDPDGPGDEVGIAAVNGPEGTVVAGPAPRLEALLPRLADWRVTRLDTDYAFHSPALGPVADQLEKELAHLRPAPGGVPLYSTVTGAQRAGDELTGAHWAANAALPVRFSDAVDAMIDDGVTCFVEIGPHPALLPHVQRLAGARTGEVRVHTVATLRRRQDELPSLYAALGQLWAAGNEVDWAAVYPGPCPMVPLPTYPWQHRRYWISGAPAGAAPGAGAADPQDTADPALDVDAVLDRLVTHLADIMRTDPAVLDPDRSARDLDVDSVSFVELKNRLESDLAAAIPITVLTEGATLREVARTLATAGERRGPTSAQARHALDHLDELSEEELDRLMAALDSEEER